VPFAAAAAATATTTTATVAQLLRPADLTVGITAAEYKQRRQRLAQAMPQGAVAVLPAASTTFVTGVIPYVSLLRGSRRACNNRSMPARHRVVCALRLRTQARMRQLELLQMHYSTGVQVCSTLVKLLLLMTFAPNPQPYRQDADFLYLTGMAQHGVAVVHAHGEGGGAGEHRFTLFIPAADREVGGAQAFVMQDSGRAQRAGRPRWDAAAIVLGSGQTKAHQLTG
jgi:hypothetical protein